MDELDNLYYKLIVRYYTKTKLYDRLLTDERSPFDPTEAFTYGMEESQIYATWLYKKYTNYIKEIYGLFNVKKWMKIKMKLIHLSAQGWINLYNELLKRGEYDGIEIE